MKSPTKTLPQPPTHTDGVQPEQPCHLFQEWLQLSQFSHQTVKTIMTLTASRCLLPGHWRNKSPLKSILNNVTVENCRRQLHVHLVKATTRVICHWHPHLPHHPKLNTSTSQRSPPLTARCCTALMKNLIVTRPFPPKSFLLPSLMTNGSKC